MRFIYGSTQIKDFKGRNKGQADCKYEAEGTAPRRVRQLWQPYLAASRLSQMRVLQWTPGNYA